MSFIPWAFVLLGTKLVYFLYIFGYHLVFRNAGCISFKIWDFDNFHIIQYLLLSYEPPPVFLKKNCVFISLLSFFLPLPKSGVYNVDGYNGTKSVKINTVIFNGGEVLWSHFSPTLPPLGTGWTFQRHFDCHKYMDGGY